MTALCSPKKISGTTDFKVSHCNFYTTAKFRKIPYCPKSLFRNFRKHLVSAIHQKSIRCTVWTAYTATKLIKLGQAHFFCIVYYNGVGIWYVKTCFYYCSCYKNINVPVNKIIHYFFKLSLTHLSVCEGNTGIRHKCLNFSCHFSYVLNPVVHVINLTASCKLPVYGIPCNFLIVFHNKSLYWHTFLRWFFHYAHISYSNKAHMKSSWNRSCCKSHYVNIIFQFFNLFLMFYAKSLLFINNQKSQILKFNIFWKHTMSSDNNVNITFIQIFYCFINIWFCSKSWKHFHSDREILKSLLKSFVVLLGQNRCWNKISHLLVILHCLKSRTNCHFCLAKTYVSANQSVHNFRAFHIFFYFRYGIKLIICLLKWKHFLEFLLPFRVRRKLISVAVLPYCIKLNKLLRNIRNSLLNPGLCFFPFLAT